MQLSNNQQAFLALVRAGLWEKEVQLASFGQIDFDEILRLAEEQSVVGLVAAGLEHVVDVKLPKEFALQLAGQTLQLEQQNLAMNSFIGEIVEKMRKAGIYTLLVKGQAVAQCYERPLWRACGDIDFFLSEDNYKRAKDYLLPKSSSVEQEYKTSQHLGLVIDSWVVELHGLLHSSLSHSVNKELNNIRNDTFYGGNVRSLQNGRTQIFLLGLENDIIYVFIHFLSHFYKGGVGLRQICDWIRLLWANRETINRTELEKRLQSTKLMTEWKAFGVFAVDYLGMPPEVLPFYSETLKWKQKASQICSFILEVGNFGHNRDASYRTKPFVVRKFVSFGRKLSDIMRHARIFPFDSFRFFVGIMYNGMLSFIRREG